MENTQPLTVWIIHYTYFDGTGSGFVDCAFTSEEQARWQVKLLIDLSDGTGRTYSLLNFPVDAHD